MEILLMLAISKDIGIHNSEVKSHCAVSVNSRKKIISFVFKDSINNFSVIQTFLLTIKQKRLDTNYSIKMAVTSPWVFSQYYG